MPGQPIDRLGIGAGSSSMTQQQSREGRRARVLPADSLDACIAGLVSSGALPPAPTAAPTPYDRLYARYQAIRRIRRRITSEVRHVRHQITSFQRLPRGRLLYLTVHQALYRDREAELAARIEIFQDRMEQNPDFHADNMMDSSDNEEVVLGRDPEPFWDYGSDDGQEEVRFHVGEGPDERVFTTRVEDAEAYLRNLGLQRRTRRARGSRRAGATEARLEVSGLIVNFEDAVAGAQEARPVLSDLSIRRAPGGDFHEVYPDDLDELAFDGEEEEDEEEEDEEDEDSDDSDDSDDDDLTPDIQEDPWPNNSDVPQPEANGNDTDPGQPPGWQKFHQYFMYSCRGDLSAVTRTLQAGFQFEPHVSEAWVGRHLNKFQNVREQIEYLEAYLPSETGTLDRAEARLRMGQSNLFIQDIYDGKSAGQIFDIDPASDAYIEPIRPPDLPAAWTLWLDAALLSVLPEIPGMETFWLEYAGVLQETFEDGIGSSRKEHALSLRCGQLKYLRLSEEQLTAGREREEERVEAIFGNDTEEPGAAEEE